MERRAAWARSRRSASSASVNPHADRAPPPLRVSQPWPRHGFFPRLFRGPGGAPHWQEFMYNKRTSCYFLVYPILWARASGKDDPWIAWFRRGPASTEPEELLAIANIKNIKISIDGIAEKDGLSYRKLPVFPLFHLVSSEAATTAAHLRRAGHQSRSLPLPVPPGDSRVSEPFFIAALNSPYSARTARSWVRSAVSILFISCRNVHPSPVSFGGSKSTRAAPEPSDPGRCGGSSMIFVILSKWSGD